MPKKVKICFVDVFYEEGNRGFLGPDFKDDKGCFDVIEGSREEVLHLFNAEWENYSEK